MRNIIRNLVLFGMLFVCLLFVGSDAKAEENIFLGEIYALDAEGNILTGSGASVVTLSTGETVCIGHTLAYSESASGYVFVYEDYVEQVSLLAVYSEYGVMEFSVPSFCLGLPQGSVSGINSQTLLWELAIDSNNFMTWIDCYLVGQSEFMCQVDSQGTTSTPVPGGLVINTETKEAVGVIIDYTNNIFIDLDSYVSIRANETTGTTEASQPETTQAEGGKGGDTENSGSGGSASGEGFISYGVVVFFIVIVLIILIISLRKSNQENNNLEREYAGLEEVKEESLSLECISGEHKGVVISLDETIILGRDSEKCNLVFTSSTRGISGVHCKICRWDDNVELTDMGSTYGTYLEDGTKLSPNTPYILKIGQEFYLADRKYMYRIK